jgi:hypothetical protein
MAIDEYQLEDIARAHNIHAGVYIPFVIARLAKSNQQREVLLDVTLRNLGDTREEQRVMRLCWSIASIPALPLAISERTQTEWAACGVACAVLARYTSFYINRMANDGDRFDFWVREGKTACGLEVSGTTATIDELEYRSRLKARQLRANPYGVAGYVIVTNFATQKVICAFQQFEEDKQ